MITSEPEKCVAQNHRQSRNKLILEHLPKVGIIARRIHAGLPVGVSLEDLISDGIIGLIDAVDRYDPNYDVKLDTYARYRIRGAILDGLRALDWMPRETRKRAKLIQAAICLLGQKYGRASDEQEIAAHLKLSLEEYHDWSAETRSLSIASLDENLSEDGELTLTMFISGSDDNLPSALLERAELQCYLAHSIHKLPPKECRVLSLYFYKELSQREISKILGLKESRVSQLKSQGIKRLRALVSDCWAYQGTWSIDMLTTKNQARVA